MESELENLPYEIINIIDMKWSRLNYLYNSVENLNSLEIAFSGGILKG